MGRKIPAQQAVPTYKGESGQISSYNKVEEKKTQNAQLQCCLCYLGKWKNFKISMYANQEITSKPEAEFELTINHLLFHPIFCKQPDISYYSTLQKKIPAMNFLIQYIEH